MTDSRTDSLEEDNTDMRKVNVEWLDDGALTQPEDIEAEGLEALQRASAELWDDPEEQQDR